MVKLKADFVADSIAQIRNSMTKEWGADTGQIEDKNMLMYFFDSQRRRIVAHPREIRQADDFKCPSAQQIGWGVLQSKIRNGEDLGPHLSTRHASLFNLDGLLNEWGVHHFHLGPKSHPKQPYYVERGGPLVLALVDERTFYAINVYAHGAWEQTSIIESLHRNWPNVIVKYRLHGVGGEQLSQKERRSIRDKKIQTTVAMQDGTVYGAIGGGINTAGTSSEAVRRADQWMIEIQSLQAGLEAELNQLIPVLQHGGYNGELEVEAQLQISGRGFQLIFPRYGVLADLKVNPH